MDELVHNLEVSLTNSQEVQNYFTQATLSLDFGRTILDFIKAGHVRQDILNSGYFIYKHWVIVNFSQCNPEIQGIILQVTLEKALQFNPSSSILFDLLSDMKTNDILNDQMEELIINKLLEQIQNNAQNYYNLFFILKEIKMLTTRYQKMVNNLHFGLLQQLSFSLDQGSAISTEEGCKCFSKFLHLWRVTYTQLYRNGVLPIDPMNGLLEQCKNMLQQAAENPNVNDQIVCGCTKFITAVTGHAKESPFFETYMNSRPDIAQLFLRLLQVQNSKNNFRLMHIISRCLLYFQEVITWNPATIELLLSVSRINPEDLNDIEDNPAVFYENVFSSNVHCAFNCINLKQKDVAEYILKLPPNDITARLVGKYAKNDLSEYKEQIRFFVFTAFNQNHPGDLPYITSIAYLLSKTMSYFTQEEANQFRPFILQLIGSSEQCPIMGIFAASLMKANAKIGIGPSEQEIGFLLSFFSDQNDKIDQAGEVMGAMKAIFKQFPETSSSISPPLFAYQAMYLNSLIDRYFESDAEEYQVSKAISLLETIIKVGGAQFVTEHVLVILQKLVDLQEFYPNVGSIFAEIFATDTPALNEFVSLLLSDPERARNLQDMLPAYLSLAKYHPDFVSNSGFLGVFMQIITSDMTAISIECFVDMLCWFVQLRILPIEQLANVQPCFNVFQNLVLLVSASFGTNAPVTPEMLESMIRYAPFLPRDFEMLLFSTVIMNTIIQRDDIPQPASLYEVAKQLFENAKEYNNDKFEYLQKFDSIETPDEIDFDLEPFTIQSPPETVDMAELARQVEAKLSQIK